MPRAERAQRFLIDPLAVTRDPARRLLSPAARGVYDTLWLESWLEKEPGHLPSDETILAGLAQVTRDVWVTVRDEVRDMFEVTEKNWICRAVTRTKNDQDSRRDGWRKRQRDKRKRERDSSVTVQRDMSVSSPVGSGTGTGTGTGTGSGSRETENHTLVPNGFALVPPTGKPRTRRAVQTDDWRAAFFDLFWPDWLSLGRPCSKAKALAAWLRIPHADAQQAFDQLDLAFDKARGVWRTENRDARTTPHAATWLNDYAANLKIEVTHER